jgi:glycosyltransferase involved in cell wall biosynthesis
VSARSKASGRVFLVTYHALPAAAVGGLRLSTLAEYLVSEGLEVSLFSARETPDGSTRSLDPRIRRHQIPDRKLWRKALLLAVRAVRRALGLNEIASSKAEKESSSVDESAQHAERSLAAKLRFHFFRVSGAVDDNKWWSVKLFVRLAIASIWRKPAVIVVSGPPFSPVVAASVFSRLSQIPRVVDLRDPWFGRASRFEYAGLRAAVDQALERYCIVSAAAVTTTAPSLADVLRERYVMGAHIVQTILNGFDPEMVVKARPPVGVLRLLYAGTIYENRSPMPLLEGIVRLVKMRSVDAARVELVMAGSCSRWRDVSLLDWVKSAEIDSCVRFIGQVSRDEVRKLIEASNVLVNLAQGQKQQVPAKLFEHVASGRQVLLFAEPDSDSARIARQLRNFLRVDDSVEDVTEVLRKLYEEYVNAIINGDVSERGVLSQTLSRRETSIQFYRLVTGIAQSMPRFG